MAAVSTLDWKTLVYEQAQGSVRYQSSDSHLNQPLQIGLRSEVYGYCGVYCHRDIPSPNSLPVVWRQRLPYDLRSEVRTPRYINGNLNHRLMIHSLQSDSFWRLRRILSATGLYHHRIRLPPVALAPEVALRPAV